MIYEIRLKGRQKQGQCSAILTMAFFILVLSTLSVNLIPLVYITAIKPVYTEPLFALIFSAVILIVFMLTYSCLSLGTDRFMLKRAENTVAGAGDIFYYFKPMRMISMSLFFLRFNIRRLIIFISLSLPFLLCFFIFYSLCTGGFSALVCSIFGIFSGVFLLLAVETFIKINDTFFYVRYRYIKGEYLNFRHLLSQSQQEMKNKTFKLRQLRWSFIGWFLLCLLVFPIPYVWCYYRQTKACFVAKE